MIKHIPFLDLKSQYQELKDEFDIAFHRVMDSGWYILGEEVDEFEKEYASYCGVQFCIGVGNGLDALHLILRAYGIGHHDEVIVPANTYIASWLAITYAGAKPVPVEPDLNTYNIDASRIIPRITYNTRAIMPVHLYGQPTIMDEIWEIAEKYGLKIIEDSAQTHGGLYKGRMAGNLGHSAGFSFYPSKNLGAFGDAGCILTNDIDIAKKTRIFRNYGSRNKYYNDVKGFNSRLDPLQAAFLRVKLRHLDEWNQRRSKIATLYLNKLSNIPDLILPKVAPSTTHVWHIFVIRHPKRDQLQEFLKHNGIDTLIHYPIPPHLSKAYKDLGYKIGDFPITESIANTVLSLPIGPHLSQEDVEIIVDKIKEFCLQ